MTSSSIPFVSVDATTAAAAAADSDLASLIEDLPSVECGGADGQCPAGFDRVLGSTCKPDARPTGTPLSSNVAPTEGPVPGRCAAVVSDAGGPAVTGSAVGGAPATAARPASSKSPALKDAFDKPVSREAVEQAAAILAMFWDALPPELRSAAARATDAPELSNASGIGSGPASYENAGAGPSVALVLPSGREIEFALPAPHSLAQSGEGVVAAEVERAAAIVRAQLEQQGVAVRETAADFPAAGLPSFADSLQFSRDAAEASKPVVAEANDGLPEESPSALRLFLSLPGGVTLRFNPGAVESRATRENIAAPAVDRSPTPSAFPNDGEKNFLPIEYSIDTDDGPIDGIGVAHAAHAMSSSRTSATPPGLPVRLDPGVVSTADTGGVSASPVFGPGAETSAEAVSCARKAVATITGLVDAQFSARLLRHPASVSLHVAFAGHDLAVHVQLRDGAIHAQFQTDSAELRTALSNEWQSIAVQSPDDAARYAPPVFTAGSSDRTGTSFSFNEQAREHGRFAQEPAPGMPSFLGAGIRTSPGAGVADDRPASRSAPATSVHLSVFA